MTELTKGEQELIHECYKAKERVSQLENALQAMLDRYATGFNGHDKEARQARELLEETA